MDQPSSDEMPSELGYYFHPQRYQHSPGHPALEVFIRPEPTRRHYDPERLDLAVKETDPSRETSVQKLSVVHPWHGVSEHRVVPGRVFISDRRDKKIGAYCFGGELTIESQQDMTSCLLCSPAPILELFEMDSLPGMLATFVEVMLAEIRAEAIPDLEGYQARLSLVEPLRLYQACLWDLWWRLSVFKHQDLVAFEMLRSFILGEVRVLKEKEKWPQRPSSLRALLLPPPVITMQLGPD